MDAIDLREIHRQLEELRIRCDYIEANQRNAESGTTACSAAGGGIEQVKTAHSAGKKPCPPALLTLAEETYAIWGGWTDENRSAWWDELASDIQLKAYELINESEARRRDAGYVEPPTG